MSNIRHLHEAGQTHTMCGTGRTQCLSVHVTKARKSDCTRCRQEYRMQIRKRRLRSMQTVKQQTVRPPRDQCPECFEPLTVGHKCYILPPLPKAGEAFAPIKPEMAAHLNTQCGNPECGVCHICQWNHKTSEHPKQKVYVLVQEVESGAETYELLSAHKTKPGAEAAEQAWTEDHEGMSSESHAFNAGGEGVDWCLDCGCCVRVVAMELED